MDDREPGAQLPPVRLGHVSDDSIAPSVYVLVRQGVQQRPELAGAMRGSIRMRCLDGYAAIRIDFRGDEIEVADDDGDPDRAYDLEITGRLGDISALIVSPLAGGLPKPTTRPGRQALARLADGRVEFDGPLSLGRSLLRLLAIEPLPAGDASRRSRRDVATAPD